VKSYIQEEERRLIGSATSCVGTSFLKYTIEGKIGRIDVAGRQGRRNKQLLDDLKERRGDWKLKVDALDRTVWRTLF
jgi:hypothetical protein